MESSPKSLKANTLELRPLTSLGVGGAQERQIEVEQGRHVRPWLSERCPQSIAKLTIDLGRPNLHGACERHGESSASVAS